MLSSCANSLCDPTHLCTALTNRTTWFMSCTQYVADLMRMNRHSSVKIGSGCHRMDMQWILEETLIDELCSGSISILVVSRSHHAPMLGRGGCKTLQVVSREIHVEDK